MAFRLFEGFDPTSPEWIEIYRCFFSSTTETPKKMMVRISQRIRDAETNIYYRYNNYIVRIISKKRDVEARDDDERREILKVYDESDPTYIEKNLQRGRTTTDYILHLVYNDRYKDLALVTCKSDVKLIYVWNSLCNGMVMERATPREVKYTKMNLGKISKKEVLKQAIDGCVPNKITGLDQVVKKRKIKSIEVFYDFLHLCAKWKPRLSAELLSKLLTISESSIDKLFKGDLKWYSYLPVVHKYFFLSHGYLTPCQSLKIKNIQTRSEQLRNLSKIHIKTLGNLYGFDEGDNFAQLLKIKTVDKLESWIIPVTKDNFTQFAEKLMVIPSHVSDKYEYYLLNIISYRDVVNRGVPTNTTYKTVGRKISMYTDVELINLFEGIPYYENRPQLVRYLLQLETNEMFFCPGVWRSRSQNRETLTTLDDVSTIAYPIAFGTRDKHFIYSFDDLIAAFTRNNTSALTLFYKPETNCDMFEIEDIRTLIKLIKWFQPDSNRLLQIIQKGFSDLENRKLLDEHVVKDLRQIDQKVVMNMLKNYLEIGMYMRQWKGKNAYPLSSQSTSVGMDETTIFYNVTVQSSKFEELLNSYPQFKVFVSYAPLYHLTQNKQIVLNTEFSNIRDHLNAVLPKRLAEGEMPKFCIRQNSSVFIATAAYYWNRLYGIGIPGLNITDVALIS
jgi:hypothetical protein